MKCSPVNKPAEVLLVGFKKGDRFARSVCQRLTGCNQTVVLIRNLYFVNGGFLGLTDLPGLCY